LQQVLSNFEHKLGADQTHLTFQLGAKLATKYSWQKPHQEMSILK
jgi:hypothetical protein